MILLLQISRILHECSCLLNFLNELGKSDKIQGLLSILSLFRSEFDRLDNIGAKMLDSAYHMTLKLLRYRIWV